MGSVYVVEDQIITIKSFFFKKISLLEGISTVFNEIVKKENLCIIIDDKADATTIKSITKFDNKRKIIDLLYSFSTVRRNSNVNEWNNFNFLDNSSLLFFKNRTSKELVESKLLNYRNQLLESFKILEINEETLAAHLEGYILHENISLISSGDLARFVPSRVKTFILDVINQAYFISGSCATKPVYFSSSINYLSLDSDLLVSKPKNFFSLSSGFPESSNTRLAIGVSSLQLSKNTYHNLFGKMVHSSLIFSGGYLSKYFFEFLNKKLS